MVEPTQVSAPEVQLMSAEAINQLPGVVIQEVLQGINVAMELIDGGFQAASKFNIYAVPPGKRVAREHEDPGAWTPGIDEIASLPQAFFAQEESSCCLRAFLAACGGLNLRALKLHILGGAGEAFTVERPCKFGGLCCSPLEMTVMKGPRVVGKVAEDWRCFEQSCTCLFRHDILAAAPGGAGALEKRYQLVIPLSCCVGRVNNCCGATCCKPHLIMDVESPEGELASTVVKTYGKGQGCAGCCRCAFQADNYIVEFPPGSTEEERATLIAAVFQAEYVYFSRKGGDNDG